MKFFYPGRRWKVEGGNNLSASRLPPFTKRTAFTLIEMIGVMAIISILAAIVIPPMVATVETSDAEKEDANLEEIARALLVGIKAEGRIPNPEVNPTSAQGWASMASTYSVLGSNAVLRSIQRSANDTTRRFFLSPQLTNFLNGSYSAGSTWGISNFPNSAYFILLSVSKDDMQFAATCRTNANLASNDIVWLQNWAQIYNTAGRVVVDNLNIVGTIADSSVRWTNRGQFMHLKIVNLRELFCRIDLYDRHSPVSLSTPLNNSSGDKPTQSEIYSSGFKIYISDTNANNWENGISVISQPSENSLSVFQSKVKRSDWREMTILIPTVKNNGTATNYSLSLSAPDGPFFSVNSASTNPITFFGNPNSSSAIRKDSTNFYVLYGSSIKLLDNSGTNAQIVFKANQDATYRFINGSWQN